MSTQHINVRGFNVSIDGYDVTSSNGTVHHYHRARLPLGVDPFTHRSRRAKVLTDKTMEGLEAKILAAIDVRMQLGGVAESKVTVGEWVDYYLDNYLEGAVNTKRNMRLTCKNHIVPCLGDIYLQELTEMQVEDFREHLLRDKGLAPSTVANIISVLNMILDRAVHNRAIPINPASMVRKPRKRHRQKVILSKEQTGAFMDEIGHDRYGNLMGLLLTTGFRVGEGQGLAESRVDLDRRRITVNQHVIMQDVDGRARPVLASSTKTGIDRTITVPRQALEYVEAELAERDGRSLRAGCLWHNPHGLVFAGDKGDILHYSTIDHHLKHIGTRIGRPDLTLHTLRHTAATILYLRSHNIIWVRDMLGHQNLATTERYIHVTTEDLQSIPFGHAQEMERIRSEEVPLDLHVEDLSF